MHAACAWDNHCMFLYTFTLFLKSVHFANNEDLDNSDRFIKVRKLFDNLNESSKKYMPNIKERSIDECMIPYYGPHGDKQYIRGKPVRYGFKCWAMCSSTGWLFHAEPYCGKSTWIPDVGLGQGPNVVLGHRSVGPGALLYFDNLFTSATYSQKEMVLATVYLDSICQLCQCVATLPNQD